MKPKRIILIRHGESEGNVDKTIYTRKPDWKLELTSVGKLQAQNALEAYKIIIEKIEEDDYVRYHVRADGKNTMAYCSPLVRAVETLEPFKPITYKTHYDPRIREQEWGNFQQTLTKEIREERYKFGSFFYRFPFGESGADVYDRISSFFDTMYRDFEKKEFPINALISTHGLTAKVFLMRWLHWSVEEFEYYDTPDNCQLLIMERDPFTDKYNLITKLIPMER